MTTEKDARIATLEAEIARLRKLTMVQSNALAGPRVKALECDETPAEEFSRLVIEYNEGEGASRQEAWNLIADFALEHCDPIIRALGTTAPAGGDGGVAAAEPEHADDCGWDKPRLTLARRCTCGALAEAEPDAGEVEQPTFLSIVDLIGEFGREVFYLLDDCETSGPVGEEVHTITSDGLDKVSAILDRIDDLPFEEPGYILGTGAKLQAALKQTFAAALRQQNAPGAEGWRSMESAPEGQQEPVAWRVRGAQYDRVFLDKAEAHEIAAGFLGLVTPLYASPSEQAVTEAMVERAFRDGVQYGTICDVTDIDEAWRTSAVRAALKAAMEAGR